MKKKIGKKIEELNQQKATIAKYSAFGVNNWEQADIEIEWLEKVLENPTKENLNDILCDITDKITDIQDNYSEANYEAMDNERSPYSRAENFLAGIVV